MAVLDRERTVATDEQDERPVEEVRCAETGVPLPTIPVWYAHVKVRFISDAHRQKTAKNLADAMAVDVPAVRSAEEGEDDLDLEDDLELDEAEEETEEEMDLGETGEDAEAEK